MKSAAMRNLEDGNRRLHAKVDAISRQIMLTAIGVAGIGAVAIVMGLKLA